MTYKSIFEPKRTWLRFAIVCALLIASTWIVYFSGGTSKAYVHLYYVAILFGAAYWARLGGILTGVASGLLCGPLMDLDTHTHAHQSLSNWLVRLAIFVIMGALVGEFLRRLKRDKAILEERNQALVKSQEQLAEERGCTESLGTELIWTLARAIELRDPYTNGHCTRVGDISVEIGQELGMSEVDLLHLRWSAIIHDVGKIAIPESILNKPGPLTQEEYDVVKQHPSLGEWALRDVSNAKFIANGVLYHHERWDGSGYPSGLHGEQIPLQARIIGVADVWDAITTARPYRGPLSRAKCLSIMREGRGTDFDPRVLDVFMDILQSSSQQDTESGA